VSASTASASPRSIGARSTDNLAYGRHHEPVPPSDPRRSHARPPSAAASQAPRLQYECLVPASTRCRRSLSGFPYLLALELAQRRRERMLI
jgi:hypothetical protein